MADMAKQFVEQFGEDLLQQICEAAWEKRDIPDVMHWLDHHMHNAANHTHQGILSHGDKEYLLEMEQGDRNGLLLHYGEDMDLEPVPVYTNVFRPIDPDTEIAKMLFPYWQKQEWFQEKQRKMAYDLLFSPGGVTEKHYNDWAKPKGLKIVRVKQETA